MKKLLILCLLFSNLGSLFAAEGSLYDFSWLDPDKKVFVLQNRRYTKKKRPYVAATAGLTTSGAFTSGFAGQLRGGYFFKEEWGVELLISKNSSSENSTAKALKEDTNATPFYRVIDLYAGGMFQWSPFYGKLNTFRKISYIDWTIGLGPAFINDNNNREDISANQNPATGTESHVGLIWGTGIRFYLNNKWGLRLDFTGLHYNAEKSNLLQGNEKELFSHYDLTLGLQYTF